VTKRTISERMVGVALSDLKQKFPALDEKSVALLKQIGVTSLVSLLSLPIERLSALLNLNFHSANKLRRSLMEQYSPVPCSGLGLYQAAPDPPILSTGCRAFDAILGGGLRSGEICEVFGGPSTGKTQLCLSAVALCALSGGKVVYIDTAGDLCLQRLSQVVEARGCSREKAEEALERVLVAKAWDPTQMLATIEQLGEVRADLVVLDNLSIPFMPMVTNNSLSAAFAAGSRVVQALRKISTTTNPPPAILATCNLRAGRDLEPAPALGGVFRGLADTRVLLTRVDATTLQADIVRGLTGSCNYSLGKLGVT